MNNKKVHWSQYADKISFLTIQNTVRLSASVDNDYFSEESADLELLETPEMINPAPLGGRKGFSNKFPQALKEDKFQERKFNMKVRRRDAKYEEENNYEEEMDFLVNSDDNSTLSPGSCDDTLDTLSSPRKWLDNYWISPPIFLSKGNSSVSRGDYIKSGRLNLNQKSGDRLSRISPAERRSYQNVDQYRYRISTRHSSELRRSRLGDKEEKPFARKSF
ncbi:hypothetical protein ACTXT7_013216 [Hymenolepis weldensis]